jgi:hypothetical protein
MTWPGLKPWLRRWKADAQPPELQVRYLSWKKKKKGSKALKIKLIILVQFHLSSVVAIHF